jgi:hypothetical protein
VNVDPKLLVRPRTANPWLRRLFESEIPIAEPDESVDPPALSGSTSLRKKKESEILWSSQDVVDWRLLARPHASNPILTSAQEKEDVVTSPSKCTQSEVIWEEAGLAAAGAGAQGGGDFDLLSRAPAAAAPTADALGELRAAVFMQSERIGALEMQLAVIRQLLERFVGQEAGHDSAKRSQPRQETEYPSPSIQPIARSCENSNVAGAAPHCNPSPPLEHYPPYAAPAPLSAENRRDPEPRDDVLETITEDCSTMEEEQEQRLDRAAHASHTPHKPHEDAELQRPETAQSRHVSHLRSVVEVSRPQSAPLRTRTYKNFGGRSVHRGEVTDVAFFENEQSTALLLNNECIRAQYRELVRPGEAFARKDDFAALYKRRAEEYGVVTSDRELQRKLQRFSSAGKDVISFEEFAVLYLHIAQW